MASQDHTILSDSSNPAFEIVKHIIIDIKNGVEFPDTTKWNIFKVPCNLRSLNESAYTPQLVSIGPLHYGQEKLNPMQKQKLQYLNFFRDRVENNIDDMDYFKKYLKGKEGDIRQCYAERLNKEIDKDKLVDMMLLDSIFIMELFLRIQRQKSDEEESKNNNNVMKQTYPDDIIVKQSWLNKSIQRDLLLLENQIPLFILTKLYNIVPEPDRKRPTFIELAQDYFECYNTYKKADSCSDQEAASLCFSGKPSKENNTTSASGLEKKSSPRFKKMTENWGDNNCVPRHFTDLIRFFYICKDLEKFDKGSPSKTATKLRESGVSFVKVNDKPLIDIKFQKVRPLPWFLCLGCFPKSTYFKARLQIPELKVEDTTECVLRNLIAFEQCYYPNQPYICNYVSFIDSLIHTKDDVELLVEKEVIMHELGSDKEVATLVNGLCKYVVTNKTCYADTIKSLNNHYQNQWYRTMAALRLVYFRDTWRASSTLVATAVLVFTIFNFCRVVRLVLDLEGVKRP